MSKLLKLNKKKLLFFGDIAPKYLSGTSIAAKTNLDILKDTFQLYHIEEQDDWKIHSKGTVKKAKKLLGHLKLLRQVLKKEKVDILYTHLSSSFVGMIKTLSIIGLARLCNVEHIVLHLHRGDYNSVISNGLVTKLLNNRIASLTDTVITLSTGHADQLSQIWPQSKIKVLENTVELDHDIKYKQEPAEPFTFLYLSNYIEAKGVLDLLEAFAIRRNQASKLVLYGNSFHPTFTQRMERYGSDHVEINDSVGGVNKFKKIASAECLVLPSWNEGQPIVILEAMSVGTLVLATDVGFVSELLGEEYPYIIEPRDKHKLASMLDDIVDSDVDHWRAYLYDRYQQLFSPRAHRSKLVQIFKPFM